MSRVFRRLNIDERDLDEFSTSKDALFNYNDKRIPLKRARLKGDGEETEPVTIYTRYSPDYRDAMEADRPPT